MARENRLFDVQLLRLEAGEWLESLDRCELCLRAEGLTLRSLPQKTLLLDLPRGIALTRQSSAP